MQAFVHFNGTERRFPLASIKSSKELSNADGFTSAVALCPQLESVSVTASGAFREAALWSLTRLANLGELTLANGPDSFALEFYADVVPLLQTVGHQLSNLILTRFTCVDVSGIF